MTVYRALRNLSNGVQRGAVTGLRGIPPSDIEKLEKVGAVAKVSAPPLVVLPEWRTRAKPLEGIGITTIEQVIEADPALIATACAVEVEVVGDWQKEAVKVLIFHRVERV